MLSYISQFFQRLIFCVLCALGALEAQSKICIIMPAYNEETRIEHTLNTYAHYFQTKPEETTFLVVANNCKDKTVKVAHGLQKHHPNIEVIDLKPGGKGFAVKEGFLWALDHDFDLIGFVDADMATLPEYFYDLVIACANTDGAIASRYAKGADVFPSRPWLRKVGGKLYNWMLRKQLGLPFKDTQCGAKIFTKDTIQKVTPHMTETSWAFDLELLYLCQLEGKKIKEIPTTWSDQPGSHLTISSKIMKEFLNSPKRIKQRHAPHKKNIQQQTRIKKKQKQAKQKHSNKKSKSNN